MAIYFTLLAKRKDKRFYYLAFPVAMAAFLTRYTSALIIIPILLVIIMILSLGSAKSQRAKSLEFYIFTFELFFSEPQEPLTILRPVHRNCKRVSDSYQPRI